MTALRRETLFLACTRPAMRYGVPMEGFYLNSFGVVFVGMIMGSPFYWLLMVPVHYVMKWYANKNPNFFRELRIWWMTKGRNVGGALWAMPRKGPRDPENLPASV